MTRKLLFTIASLVAFGAILAGCDRAPNLSDGRLGWQYVKSPAGKCYEVGTHASWGGFTFTVVGQVDDSYCK